MDKQSIAEILAGAGVSADKAAQISSMVEKHNLLTLDDAQVLIDASWNKPPGALTTEARAAWWLRPDIPEKYRRLLDAQPAGEDMAGPLGFSPAIAASSILASSKGAPFQDYWLPICRLYADAYGDWSKGVDASVAKSVPGSIADLTWAEIVNLYACWDESPYKDSHVDVVGAFLAHVLNDFGAVVGVEVKGGEGSGNFGHRGRPGEVGGSGDGTGSGIAAGSKPGKPKTAEDIFATRFSSGLSKDEWAQLFALEEQRSKDGYGRGALSNISIAIDKNERGYKGLPKNLILQYGKEDPASVFRWMKDNPNALSQDELLGILKDSNRGFIGALLAMQETKAKLSVLDPERWAQIPGANIDDYFRYVAMSSSDKSGFTGMLRALLDKQPLPLPELMGSMKKHLNYWHGMFTEDAVDAIVRSGDHSPADLRAFAVWLGADSESMPASFAEAMKGEALFVTSDGKTLDAAPDGTQAMKSLLREGITPSIFADSPYVKPAYMAGDISNRKDAVAQALSSGDSLTYDEASEFVAQWAKSSNDSDLRSLGIQEIAAEKFGVELSDWQKLGLANVPDSGAYLFEEKYGQGKAKSLIGKALDTVYQNTQAELEKRGIDNVHLYRGVKLRDGNLPKAGSTIEFDDSALSSWTTNPKIAMDFADYRYGMVVSTVVPRSKIYSTPLTGQGCSVEEEVIVIGNQGTAHAVVEWVTQP